MSSVIKSRASSLLKVTQLPRYRHPSDLINQTLSPMSLQNKQISGQLPFDQNLYHNLGYQSLMKIISITRQSFRITNGQDRKKIANEEFNAWDTYLKNKVQELPDEYKVNDEQKQRIYQSLIVTKERNQQRLALNRFNPLFSQYSKAYKFDIRLNPLVMMRLTYPHFGYLNLFPSIPAYKLTMSQVVELLQQCIVASIQRDNGNSLHSSELMSLISWKLYTRKLSQRDAPQISVADFNELLMFFKFNKDSFPSQFSYSIAVGEFNNQKKVRFDLWRQIFLDRNL